MSSTSSSVREPDLRGSSPAAKPDVYISDLAGQEIDRLLEGDEPRRPVSPQRQVDSPIDAETAALLDADLAAGLDAGMSTPASLAQPKTPEEPASVTPAEPAESSLTGNPEPVAISSEQTASLPATPSAMPDEAGENHVSAAIDASADVLDTLPEPAEMSATIGPESAVLSSIGRELDQVFEQQVGGTAQDPLPSNSVQTPDPAVLAPTGSESATPQSATADAPDASVETAAQQADHAAETVSPDGVSDLLNRLTAGERPTSPGVTTPATQPSEHLSADHKSSPTEAVPATVTPQAQAPAELTTPAADSTAPAVHVDESPHADSAEVQPISVVMAPPPASSASAGKLLDFVAFVLDPFSDQTREAVGKIAIITAVNALAILIYVLFFRG